MDCYEIVKSIGSGSFGQVYMARHKREDRLYVIKRIKIRDMTQKERENTENEVRLLQKLRHPNIVAYKDSYLDREQYLNIVMTYCEGGDVYQKIRQSKQKNFPESTIIDWLSQVALALFYLHDQKILHRDLKTQNIFLKNGRVRLGDFGIAKVLDSTRDLANTCIGTPFYMSPELFRYKPYSYKSDVWAMGCCMYEMCNLRHAFDAQSIQGLALKIMKGSYPPITPIYSKQLRDLISRMLNLNQKARPSILEIVNKPLVKNRIILFMLDVFRDKNLDPEDIYVDTLWEQADKLQITPIINHYLNLINQGVKFEDIAKEIEKGGGGEQKLLMQLQEQELIKKKLLKKEQMEKKKLEEEMQRLEIRRNYHDEGKQDSIRQTRAKNLVSLERETKSNTDYRSKKDQSYSLEKDTPTQQKKYIKQPLPFKQQNKQQIKELLKGQTEDRSNSVEKQSQYSIEKQSQFSQQSSFTVNQSSTNTQSTQQQSKKGNDCLVDAKQKVLNEKYKKQNEQKERWEKEFQMISQQNMENRKKAQEQKFAQYRPSSGMNQIFKKEDEKFNQNSLLIETKNRINGDAEEVRQEFGIDEFISKKSNESKKYFPTAVSRQNGKYQDQESIDISDGNNYDEDDEEEEEEEEQDVNPIPEVENEDEYEEVQGNEDLVEKRIELVKTKLKEKTYRINELQQSLLQSKKFKEQQIKALQSGKLSDLNNIPIISNMQDEPLTPLIENDNIEEENFDELEEREDFLEDDDIQNKGKIELNPQQVRMNDRLKLLRHRCEAGLGKNLFEKAYDLIKDKGSITKGDEMRKIMLDTLGEDNVAYWHLIDQLLYVEELFKQASAYVN